MSRNMKFALGLVGFLVVVGLCNNLTRDDETRTVATEEPRQQPREASTQTLEYKLATIDAGGFVREDDPSVARIRTLLGNLERKFSESQQQIGDMTVRAVEMLRDEKGVVQSIVDILEGMNRITTSSSGELKYAEMVSAYIVLRGDESQTHEESIAGLRGVLRGLGVN